MNLNRGLRAPEYAGICGMYIRYPYAHISGSDCERKLSGGRLQYLGINKEAHASGTIVEYG